METYFFAHLLIEQNAKRVPYSSHLFFFLLDRFRLILHLNFLLVLTFSIFFIFVFGRLTFRAISYRLSVSLFFLKSK